MGKHAILLSIAKPTRAPLEIDDNSSQAQSYSLFYVALGISLTVILVLVFLALLALFFLKKEEKLKRKKRRSENITGQQQQNGSKNGKTAGLATVSGTFSEMTHL